MKALEGKVIVIIGGTTGLGLSAARHCIAQGARTVLVGRNPESAQAAEDEIGERTRTVTGDAREAATSEKAIATAREAFGGFHGLYHVAGGSGRRYGDGPLHEVTEEGIDFTLELNLKSLILSNRAAVRAFMEGGSGGSILNMGSVLGYSPSPQYFATHVYAAAKAGIIGFTKSIASKYAEYGIRANVLAPALVETPMAKRAAEDEAILDFIKTKQPLDGGRIGLPEDCDAAAAFFLGDGSKFCTGQVLAVDGGWTVSEGQMKRSPS